MAHSSKAHPKPAPPKTPPRPTPASDDSYLTLFPQDISTAVAYLIRMSDHTASTFFSVIGRSIPNLKYQEETDWLEQAHALADAYGFSLRKVADTWFLAPYPTPPHR